MSFIDRDLVAQMVVVTAAATTQVITVATDLPAEANYFVVTFGSGGTPDEAITLGDGTLTWYYQSGDNPFIRIPLAGVTALTQTTAATGTLAGYWTT